MHACVHRMPQLAAVVCVCGGGHVPVLCWNGCVKGCRAEGEVRDIILHHTLHLRLCARLLLCLLQAVAVVAEQDARSRKALAHRAHDLKEALRASQV